MNKPPDWTPEQIVAELYALRESQRSMILATVDPQGQPDASYAPYVQDKSGDFYIFVSQLTRHTRNLEEGRKASVLFLEAEAQTRQIFARRRLSYRCEAQPIESRTLEWSTQLERMQKRFGQIVNTLSQLSDFRMFCLVPLEGRYVRGFGQAFHWRHDKPATWTHIGAGDLGR